MVTIEEKTNHLFSFFSFSFFLFNFIISGLPNPLSKFEEERIAHEQKMAKMEAEMKAVFQQKVAEKEAKLKQSEEEVRFFWLFFLIFLDK